jgi:hypothetical protein
MAKNLALILLLILAACLGGAVGGVLGCYLVDRYPHVWDGLIIGAFFGLITGSWAGVVLLYFKPSTGLVYVACSNLVGGFLSGAASFLFLGALRNIGIRV